jgi:TP901 family phage tail tape measure protein
MPEFVVKTAFKGADRLSPVLKRMGIRVEQFGKTATRSFRQASKSANVFGGVVKGIVAAGLIRRAALGASMAIRGLSEEFVTFDKNITKAVTRLPGGLDRTSAAFKTLGDTARREAARTEFTAGEAALGVEQLALAGFDLEKVTATLPGVLNLATNADVELAQAATMATKTLGAFGLKSKDTATVVKNLTKVNDVFSKTVSSASINMEDLFEVMKFGGPAAKAAGQDLTTFAAVSGVLADSAIDASVAGTSLRAMFTRLAAPTPKARKLIAKLGIDIKDSKGNFNDFLDIMGDVQKATGKMGNVQRLAALEVLFGKRAVNAANVILDKGTNAVKDYRKELENATGASAKMAKAIREALGNRMKRLKSALVEVGLKFIEAFNKGAGESIETAIKAISRFDVKPVVQGLKDIINFGKKVWNTLVVVKDLMPVLIGTFVGFKVALLAIKAVEFVLLLQQIAGAMAAVEVSTLAANAALVKTLTVIAPIAGVFAAMGAVIAIVATRFDVVVHGIEEGITRMGITFTEFKISFMTGIGQMVQAVSPLMEILGAGAITGGISSTMALAIGREKASLRNQKAILEDIKRESVDAEIQRGLGGIRGAVTGEKARNFKNALQFNPFLKGNKALLGASDPQEILKKALTHSAAKSRAEKSIDPLDFNPLTAGLNKIRMPVAPNRSQVEAQRQQVDVNLTFANAPPGLTVPRLRA